MRDSSRTLCCHADFLMMSDHSAFLDGNIDGAASNVPGSIQHVEPHAFDLNTISFGDTHGDDIGTGMLAHHRDAMGAVAQRTEAGHVIGVQVRIHGLDQFEIEFAHELQIAVDPLQNRVDDQRLAAMTASKEVRVGDVHGARRIRR